MVFNLAYTSGNPKPMRIAPHSSFSIISSLFVSTVKLPKLDGRTLMEEEQKPMISGLRES
jgi:hypothetical protein